MSAASLSLLKGGKKSATEDELTAPKTAPATEAQVEETEIELDPDSMSKEEILSVAKEYGLPLPVEFETLTLEDQRAWLKSQAEDETAAETSKPDAKKAEKKAKKTESLKTTKDPEIKQGGGLVTEAAADTVVEAGKDGKKPAAKPKGKAVSVSTSKEGEIVAGDVIVDIVHEVETMNEKDARSVVASLSDQTEKTYFKLGGVLSVIQANSWFQPYGTFRDYVEKEHGIQYRRAMYWISIYNKLVESKVPWSKVKDLGWTKLKVIAEILTVDNVDEWASIASSQTVLQLIDTVKAATAPQDQITDETKEASTTTTKTFKCHAGQKETIEAAIEKSKSESNTSVDTVALENICLDYLGNATIAQRLKKAGIETALKALEAAFPEANFTVELPEAA